MASKKQLRKQLKRLSHDSVRLQADAQNVQSELQDLRGMAIRLIMQIEDATPPGSALHTNAVAIRDRFKLRYTESTGLRIRDMARSVANIKITPPKFASGGTIQSGLIRIVPSEADAA